MFKTWCHPGSVLDPARRVVGFGARMSGHGTSRQRMRPVRGGACVRLLEGPLGPEQARMIRRRATRGAEDSPALWVGALPGTGSLQQVTNND
jgi:hypothetical protein